jgi:predicted porin
MEDEIMKKMCLLAFAFCLLIGCTTTGNSRRQGNQSGYSYNYSYDDGNYSYKYSYDYQTVEEDESNEENKNDGETEEANNE